MKKSAFPLIFFCVIFAFLLASCGIKNEDIIEDIQSNSSEQTVEIENAENISALFFGQWHCSRENSCNDMDITLTVTEQGENLHLDRDMVSESGIGSSHLQYDAQITNNNTLYSEYVDGVYVLTDDCLYEIFIKNGRINKYYKLGE